MPANLTNSSDPHDYGRHVFFGLRSISVSINPADAGTFKYMEPVTGTASSGDGDVTGGEATPTCKVRKEQQYKRNADARGACGVACVRIACVPIVFALSRNVRQHQI